MKKIEILGIGCAKCRKTEEEVRRATETLGWKEDVDFSLEKVEKPEEIAARGVLFTPGIVVNGKIVSTGKVPKQKEIMGWLK